MKNILRGVLGILWMGFWRGFSEGDSLEGVLERDSGKGFWKGILERVTVRGGSGR